MAVSTSDAAAFRVGDRWETERIVVKPYAAMGGLHAAIDALFEITAANDVAPEDVDRIDVDLSEPIYHHGWWAPERPLTPTGAQMNIAYSLAVGLLDGEVLAQQFSPARIEADDVWAVIGRITPTIDRSTTRSAPWAGARPRSG